MLHCRLDEYEVLFCNGRPPDKEEEEDEVVDILAEENKTNLFTHFSFICYMTNRKTTKTISAFSINKPDFRRN